MLFSKEKLEEIEDKNLASYAVRSRNTQGRKFLENEPNYRTAYQRDRDRIIHTTAFRRLEYKTQVFINYEGDYYRTRLTHTLEVSQIGRTISRALGANEDLVEAICLAHDLGHPPFGHSGETTLSSLMTDYGGFDHNKQSLRILTLLEQRYPDFAGLNLSYEVLEGLVKHETEYDKSDAQNYAPELRGNIETQICNIADELAYTAHDLDDGLRSGIINIQMLENIDLWQIITKSIDWTGNNFDELLRHRLIRRLIGIEVNELLNTTNQRLIESRITSVDELQRLSYNVVCFSEEMHRRNRQLKDFLYKYLYRNYRLVRMSVKAEKIISNLFNIFKSEPNILPLQFNLAMNEKGLERTICDHIAGMTDRYAIEEYQKLFDPSTLP